MDAIGLEGDFLIGTQAEYLLEGAPKTQVLEKIKDVKARNLPHRFDGNLSIKMDNLLKKHKILPYHFQSETFMFRGMNYHPITGATKNFSTKPCVSFGSEIVGREILVLDPNNCSYLNDKYEKLVTDLNKLASKKNDSKLSLKESLQYISHFIMTDVFQRDKSKDEKMFIEQWKKAHPEARNYVLTKNGQKNPVIPLEDFAKAHVGVCRHVSFVTAYFMDKMLQDASLRHLLPEGEVHLCRDNLDLGRHVWNIFIPKDRSKGLWHVDTLWNQDFNPAIYNCASYQDYQKAAKKYGVGAIEREISRFNT